jgi:hypothetical protein
MPTESHDQHRSDIHVKVVYAPAADKFNDPHVKPTETVGQLKATVLNFFELKEGPRPDGSVATYTLYHDKTPLEDMALTIGAVAHGEHTLDLKLAEQIVQGDGAEVPTAADLAFEEDLAEAEATEDAARWKTERGKGQEVFVTMHSIVDPNNRYQARLAWTRYADDAPSLKFRNPTTGSLTDATAWPIVRGFRPTSFDTCVNYSAEGFALHPEWQLDSKLRWRPDGNIVLKVLRILQAELDEYYGGRYKA